jgi:hypothetical protein
LHAFSAGQFAVSLPDPPATSGQLLRPAQLMLQSGVAPHRITPEHVSSASHVIAQLSALSHETSPLHAYMLLQFTVQRPDEPQLTLLHDPIPQITSQSAPGGHVIVD